MRTEANSRGRGAYVLILNLSSKQMNYEVINNFEVKSVDGLNFR